MNSTPTSKVVNSKYKSIVKKQVRAWRKSYNKFLTARENYIKWAYETQDKTYREIAQDISNVATDPKDQITYETIRNIYDQVRAKEGRLS